MYVLKYRGTCANVLPAASFWTAWPLTQGSGSVSYKQGQGCHFMTASLIQSWVSRSRSKIAFTQKPNQLLSSPASRLSCSVYTLLQYASEFPILPPLRPSGHCLGAVQHLRADVRWTRRRRRWWWWWTSASSTAATERPIRLFTLQVASRQRYVTQHQVEATLPFFQFTAGSTS